MHIERVDTRVVDVSLPTPIGTAIHSITSVGCVLVDVRTSDGAVGQGYCFTINGERIDAFEAMVRGLADAHVVGRGATETSGMWAAAWSALNPTGHKGVTIGAMSALDVACWDAVGKNLDMPLHRLWGSCRVTIPTYASSGLWLTQSIDELVEEAQSFVDRGFRAMKIRLGSPKPVDDVARVQAVREAIGPDIALHADANQKFDPKTAIRLGRLLEPFDLVWFEEPVVTHDRVGSADVRAALDVPIATGETEYTRYGIRDLVEARAADLLMPDLQRMGGYSEFRVAAAYAATHDIAISTHIFTEHSLALAGAVPGCVSVEHMDWFAPLFVEELELTQHGHLAIPDRPGAGFTFDDARIASMGC